MENFEIIIYSRNGEFLTQKPNQILKSKILLQLHECSKTQTKRTFKVLRIEMNVSSNTWDEYVIKYTRSSFNVEPLVF